MESRFLACNFQFFTVMFLLQLWRKQESALAEKTSNCEDKLVFILVLFVVLLLCQCFPT